MGIFIILDVLWLSVIARKLYLRQLGFLAEIRNNRVKFKLPAGVLAQTIIALGLASLVALSNQVHNSACSSILVGGIGGFVIYATYDLTSLSFIKGWPIPITIIDITWGTCQGIMAGLYVHHFLRVL